MIVSACDIEFVYVLQIFAEVFSASLLYCVCTCLYILQIFDEFLQGFTTLLRLQFFSAFFSYDSFTLLLNVKALRMFIRTACILLIAPQVKSYTIG